MSDIDLAQLHLAAVVNGTTSTIGATGGIRAVKDIVHGRDHQLHRQHHGQYPKKSSQKSYQRCRHCRSLLRMKRCGETEWKTGICMSCWRLLQAKILLDAAIDTHRITPKVLLHHVHFEENVVS